ncbi:MAG: tetratricopeptide repeat protein [Candidatus Acidiferrales bacterium]
MNRPLLWLPLLLVLAILLIPYGAAAQTGGHIGANSHISVQVRLPDGSAAPNGVLVELELQNTEMVAQDQTDSSGRCTFAPPGPAIYLVRAKQAGYFDAVQAVDLQNTPTGMAYLVLRPKPESVTSGPPAPPKGATGPTVSAVDLSVPEPARREYDLGQQALQNQDLDGGIDHLKKAIELHDQFPQAYAMLGTAYNQQKDWKDAQGALQKAIQLDPKAAQAYILLGATLNREKDYPEAEKALAQGFQLAPDPPDGAAAHYELAFACFSQGHWQDAEPHAAKTIGARPEFALAHWLMAQIMLKKGDGQSAINEFQTYLKLDPTGPAAPSVREVIPKIQAVMRTQ